MIFKPCFLNNQITSYEVIFPGKSTESLIDEDVKALIDIDHCNAKMLAQFVAKNRVLVDLSFTVNIHSLIDIGFIYSLIELFPKNQITLQVSSQENITTENISKISQNTLTLQSNGFRVLIDNFGQEMHSVDLATKIRVDSVRFSKHLTNGIEHNYNKFRYLSYIYGRAHEVISKQIVFYEFENIQQELLVSLFSKDLILQSNQEHPIQDVILTRKRLAIPSSPQGKNLLHKTYELISSDENISKYKIMNFIRKNDWSSLIYNSDYETTMSNFRMIYFKKFSIKSNMLVRLLYNSTKPIVFFNRHKKPIYKNKAYKSFESQQINSGEADILESEFNSSSDRVGTRNLRTKFSDFVVIEDTIAFNHQNFFVNTYTTSKCDKNEVFDTELEVYTKGLLLKDVSSLEGNLTFFVKFSDNTRHIINIFTLKNILETIKNNFNDCLIVRYGYDEILFFPADNDATAYSEFCNIVRNALSKHDDICFEVATGYFDSTNIGESVRGLAKNLQLK